AALAEELVWEPCGPSVEPASALCATDSLPLDVDLPQRGIVSIALAKIPAPRQPARGQLWFVTGGPGDSGIDDLANVAGIHELVPDLDLLTFDHRGVGRSGRLGCPEAEDDDSVDGREIAADEWPGCIAYVGETYAGELPWLTVTRAAVDLVLLTDATLEEDQ